MTSSSSSRRRKRLSTIGTVFLAIALAGLTSSCVAIKSYQLADESHQYTIFDHYRLSWISTYNPVYGGPENDFVFMFGCKLKDSAAVADPVLSDCRLMLDSWCLEIPCENGRICPQVQVDSSRVANGEQFIHYTLGAFALGDECKNLTLSFLATLTDTASGDTIASEPIRLDLVRFHNKVFSAFAD